MKTWFKENFSEVWKIALGVFFGMILSVMFVVIIWMVWIGLVLVRGG